MNQPFQAVLFDFDGVIADTMPQNYVAWRAAFRAHGVELLARDYYPLEGSGPGEVARILCRKLGLAESVAPFIAAVKDSMLVKTANLKVYPEIGALLSRLTQSGITCALVTGAGRRRIEATLPPELAYHFKVITTSDDVQKTKPNPEPYLVTARKLALCPSDCVVVENAPLGIASALAGGFYCLAIATTLPVAQLKQASEVLPDHVALVERLVGGIAANC